MTGVEGVKLVQVVGVKLALPGALVLPHAAPVLLPPLEVPIVLHAVIVRTSMQMYCQSGEATAFSEPAGSNTL